MACAMRSIPVCVGHPERIVTLIVLAFNYVGDGLRDALDPRMAGTE